MRSLFTALLSFIQFLLNGQHTPGYLAGKKSDSIRCITSMNLVKYTRIDKNFQSLKKRRVPHLMKAINACGYPYRYSLDFSDIAFKMLLPNWITGYSLSFGNDQFLVSFGEEPASGSCIVLYYDMLNRHRNLFLKDLRQGRRRYDSLRRAGKTMYLFRSRKGIYTGEIFLRNRMAIAYYTNDKKQEARLRTCILSFRFLK